MLIMHVVIGLKLFNNQIKKKEAKNEKSKSTKYVNMANKQSFDAKTNTDARAYTHTLVQISYCKLLGDFESIKGFAKQYILYT